MVPQMFTPGQHRIGLVYQGNLLPVGAVFEIWKQHPRRGRYIPILPGQYADGETGLHYNWHRYYDPDTGRYLTPDPIGLTGGINPFVYSLNNPINFIDPKGLFSNPLNIPINLTLPGGQQPIADEINNLTNAAKNLPQVVKSEIMTIGGCSISCLAKGMTGDAIYDGEVATTAWQLLGNEALKKANQQCLKTVTVKLGARILPVVGQISTTKTAFQTITCTVRCYNKEN